MILFTHIIIAHEPGPEQTLKPSTYINRYFYGSLHIILLIF